MPTKQRDPLLFDVGELQQVAEKVVTDAVQVYNTIAKRLNIRGIVWCEAKALTEKRRKKVKAAIPEYGGLRGWEECLERASKNRFLLGKEGRSATHKSWKPELDFFLQEKTIIKLIEGGYPADDYDEKARLVLPTIMTKRQEQKPFVPEPRAERLRHSILSYRKLGNHVRANAIEEELARLENRAPVLVPAPGAEDPDVLPNNGAPKTAPQTGKRRGPVFEASPADVEQVRREAFLAASEPPPFDEIPEGEDFGAEP